MDSYTTSLLVSLFFFLKALVWHIFLSEKGLGIAINCWNVNLNGSVTTRNQHLVATTRRGRVSWMNLKVSFGSMLLSPIKTLWKFVTPFFTSYQQFFPSSGKIDCFKRNAFRKWYRSKYSKETAFFAWTFVIPRMSNLRFARMSNLRFRHNFVFRYWLIIYIKYHYLFHHFSNASLK